MAEDVKPAETPERPYDDRPVHTEPTLPPEVQAPLAEFKGEEPPSPYEGSGVCYAEFGEGLVSKVEVSFLSGTAPAAERYEPSREYAAEKQEFGASRRARWFGH